MRLRTVEPAAPQGRTHTAPPSTHAWPDAVAYQEAVQNPRACFADPALSGATVTQNRRGLPLAYTGRFAVVFRVMDGSGGAWAARCFTAAPGAARYDTREARYVTLANRLPAAEVADLFVPFRYLPQGIGVGANRFPLLLMKWADGEPLGRWVEAHRGDPAALLTLAATLGEVGARLHRAGIAHGDWQHDNLLVSDNGRRVLLVDYDGVYVDELAHQPPGERGHPNYQHPLRAADYGPHLDQFPCLLLQTALLALATEPALWDSFSDGESVLFREADLRDPDQSPAFDAVRLLADGEPELVSLIDALEEACRSTERLPIPAGRAVFERVAVRRSLSLSAPASPVPAPLKRTAGGQVVASPGHQRTAAVGAWSPFDNPVARQAITAPVEMSPQITAWVASVRKLMRAHKRRERAFLWAVRLLYVGFFYWCNNPPSFAPPLWGFWMVMGFPLLTAICFFFWPANLAGLDLQTAAEQNNARLLKLETVRKRTRDQFQAINQNPENLSAVAYVAAALKKLRLDAPGAAAWSNLTPDTEAALVGQGIRTLGDVNPNAPIPAYLGSNGEAMWKHLATRKAERIQAARTEYESVDARRRELQRDLDRLDRERAGLLSIEGELTEERARIGNDRFSRYLARLIGFWT